VDRPEERAPGVLDLVALAPRDEEQAARGELVAPLLDERAAASVDDEEPLVGAPVPVARIAFRVAGRDHHLRALRARVAGVDAESFAQAQSLESHPRYRLQELGRGQRRELHRDK